MTCREKVGSYCTGLSLASSNPEDTTQILGFAVAPGALREVIIGLSLIAAPELGLLPEMSLEEGGIVITREDDGYTVPTYILKSSDWPQEQVAKLAARVLANSPLTGKWLFEAGFSAAFGALPERKGDQRLLKSVP
jgi:hypothetical protein